MGGNMRGSGGLDNTLGNALGNTLGNVAVMAGAGGAGSVDVGGSGGGLGSGGACDYSAVVYTSLDAIDAEGEDEHTQSSGGGSSRGSSVAHGSYSAAANGAAEVASSGTEPPRAQPASGTLDDEFAGFVLSRSQAFERIPSTELPSSSALQPTARSLDDPFASARLDEQFEVWIRSSAAGEECECTPPGQLPLPSPRTGRRAATFRSAPTGVHVPVLVSEAPPDLGRPVRRALMYPGAQINEGGGRVGEA